MGKAIMSIVDKMFSKKEVIDWNVQEGYNRVMWM